MKKLKQIIFLLTVLAMFMIAGSLDCGEISFGAAMAASAVNFIVMAWSGFSSGLLAVPYRGDDKEVMIKMTYEEMVNFAKCRIVRICDMYVAIDDSKLMHHTYKSAFKSELAWIKKEIKNCIEKMDGDKNE